MSADWAGSMPERSVVYDGFAAKRKRKPAVTSTATIDATSVTWPGSSRPRQMSRRRERSGMA